MKILILPMGGIGNMLMFTPVLEKLHKEYPKAKIKVIMVNDAAKKVLKYFPYIDLDVVDKLSLKLAMKLRKEKFDLCLIPYPSAGIRKMIFAKTTGSKRIISHPYTLFKRKTNLFTLFKFSIRSHKFQFRRF